MPSERSDDPIPDDFDYGERREDGQFENYPTIDEGEFVQDVRYAYVHEACGTTTRMRPGIAKSVARAPTAYDETFCTGCGRHVPVEEVRWKEDGEPWAVDDEEVVA